MTPPPPSSPLFPYTTLFRSELVKTSLGRYAIAVIGEEPRLAYNRVLLSSVLAGETASHDIELKPASWWRDRGVTLKDRKSTRLNSSHPSISYAVFCLKKKRT